MDLVCETETELKFRLVEIREVDQNVVIGINLPEKLIEKPIFSFNKAIEKIISLSDWIKEISYLAFVENRKEIWDLVQNILYYWNYRDLTRVARNNYSAFIENTLRKIVLDIQKENAINYRLDCASSFTPEKAVKELADRALSHRINDHELLETMNEQGLSIGKVKTFLENYYVNNRLFHLFICALTLCTPFSRRSDLANNFYDEMGAGDPALAHPTLFLKNFNGIAGGIPKLITPLPGALSLANAKTNAAFLSGNYHYGMGGFGFIELTMPNQMKKILSGLQKSGIKRQDLEFWELHIKVDIVHGETWFSNMLEIIKTPEDALYCLQGGMSLLDARAKMYDEILK